jgi:hypothetical protein
LDGGGGGAAKATAAAEKMKKARKETSIFLKVNIENSSIKMIYKPN